MFCYGIPSRHPSFGLVPWYGHCSDRNDHNKQQDQKEAAGWGDHSKTLAIMQPDPRLHVQTCALGVVQQIRPMLHIAGFT